MRIDVVAGAARIRRAAKSAEAFRTISEVATELDVPQHVLRFWESRFAPDQAGEARRRPALSTGPRMSICCAASARLLYGDGLTIKGVQKVLKERGLRHVAMIGRGQASAPYARASRAERSRRSRR